MVSGMSHDSRHFSIILCGPTSVPYLEVSLYMYFTKFKVKRSILFITPTFLQTICSPVISSSLNYSHVKNTKFFDLIFHSWHDTHLHRKVNKYNYFKAVFITSVAPLFTFDQNSNSSDFEKCLVGLAIMGNFYFCLLLPKQNFFLNI